MLLRTVTKSSLDWLVGAGLLPAYREGGAFVPAVSGVQSFALGEPQQMLMHYAPLDGRLYADLDAWRRATRVVAAFIADIRAAPPWTPQKPFLVFEPLRPSDALDQAHSALTRVGLALVDRNDRNGTALFRAEETCRVLDLPEPYGKWFQHREHKPCWGEPRPLRLDVKCAIEAQRQAPGAGMGDAYAAALTLEFSALAMPIAIEVHTALASLSKTARPFSPRAVAALFEPTARAWLEPRT